MSKRIVVLVSGGGTNLQSLLDAQARGTFGAAWLDLSTGAFLAEEHTSPETLAESLRRVRPRECLLSDEAAPALETAAQAAEIGCVTRTDAWRYDVEAAHDVLARHFAVSSLECFGLEGKTAVVSAAGALLEYVRDRLRRPVDHVRSLRLSQPDGFLLLDEATCAHLDLLPVRGRPKETTLAGVLDATKTPMGSRRLQQWIAQPLCDLAAIRERHDAVVAAVGRRVAHLRQLLLHEADRVVQVERQLRMLVQIPAVCDDLRIDLRCSFQVFHVWHQDLLLYMIVGFQKPDSLYDCRKSKSKYDLFAAASFFGHEGSNKLSPGSGDGFLFAGLIYAARRI